MNPDLLSQQDELFKSLDGGHVVPFPRQIGECHSLNATPYILSFERFREHFSTSPRRLALCQRLLAVLDTADNAGARLQALLVGGSFLCPSVMSPKDIDCVYFYVTENSVQCAAALHELWKKARHESIDIRFVPYDASPLLALKACSFFSSLYARTRESAELARGAILIYRHNPETVESRAQTQ